MIKLFIYLVLFVYPSIQQIWTLYTVNIDSATVPRFFFVPRISSRHRTSTLWKHMVQLFPHYQNPSTPCPWEDFSSNYTNLRHAARLGQCWIAFHRRVNCWCRRVSLRYWIATGIAGRRFAIPWGAKPPSVPSSTAKFASANHTTAKPQAVALPLRRSLISTREPRQPNFHYNQQNGS